MGKAWEHASLSIGSTSTSQRLYLYERSWENECLSGNSESLEVPRVQQPLTRFLVFRHEPVLLSRSIVNFASVRKLKVVNAKLDSVESGVNCLGAERKN